MQAKRRFDLWTVVSLVTLGFFVLFLLYPLWGLLRQSVFNAKGEFTLEYFKRFFQYRYYTVTIFNSIKVSLAITLVTLLLGIPISYFYSFYQLKGAKFLFVVSLLCAMSAPFIGAYAWILLLGRQGVITKFMANTFGLNIGSIYGFDGILFVQSLKLFPLVFIYMNGAFKDIDNSLLEASANMGVVGVKRFFKVILQLSMPTILAASLVVFMRAFADFGTPLLIGEGYRTFPVEIYNQYLGEHGQDYRFAAAISVIGVIMTTAIFLLQKWATSRYNFSISAMHPVEKKKPKGIGGFLMYLYSYALVGLAFLPQAYIVYLSFRNSDGAVFLPGYSFTNYRMAVTRLLGRSVNNTVLLGLAALAIIVLLAVIIAYLVVRRASMLNNVIDTLSMVPYIMPGSVIGVALVIAFSNKPFALTGTALIMIIAWVIRRMPYTIRSATATLQLVPRDVEEAATSLGTSKPKTFFRITVPMMRNGIISGAILSWISIVTELSSAIILYNNRTITLTMSTYVAISRGNDGLAAAFTAITTVVTAVSIMIYLKVSKTEDVKI